MGLARQLGVGKEEAQTYIDRYFRKFAGVAAWIDKTVEDAKECGYVTSFFKRRRRLPNLNSDDKFVRWSAERMAMNSPIQSVASDYTFIALIRTAQELKKQGLDAKLVHTVYDNILIDTPKDEVERVVAIVKRAFRTPVKAFPIGMDVDIEINEYWGQQNESSLDLMLKEIL
jgi:DNA polymerase-1